MPDSPDEFIERPRGILTKQDRRHLLDLLDEHPEEDANTVRQREYRIRQHIRHSLIDFTLLAVANKGIGHVFEQLKRPADDDPELAEGLKRLFTFLFEHLGSVDSVSPFTFLFNSGVAEGIERKYVEQGVSTRVNSVEIEVDREGKVPIDDLKETYDSGGFLLRAEIIHLLWAGEITYDEAVQAIDEWSFEGFVNRMGREAGEEEYDRQRANRLEHRKTIAIDETPDENREE
jgi:hypothetical protein